MTEAQIWFWLFTLFLAVIGMPVMVLLVISAKIDALRDGLGAKVDAVGSKIDTKIDTLGAAFDAKLSLQRDWVAGIGTRAG